MESNGQISSFDKKRKEFNSSEINVITKLECLQIIRQTLNLDSFEVIDYTIENAHRDVLGFMGEYFRLKIIIKNETGELTNMYYFVKALPIINKAQLEIILKRGQFRKECNVYRGLFPHVKNDIGRSWRPKCFLVRDDLFIFEELRHMGYRHVPDRVEFDVKHIEMALMSVARMHSSCWEYEINHLKGKPFFEVHSDLNFETLLETNTWLMAGLRASTAVALKHPIYGQQYNNLIETEFLNYQTKLFDLLKTSTTYRNVFVHRDLWINNLMFKYRDSDHKQPEHCVILDFQNALYCPPALDFMILLFFNTRRATRDLLFEKYQNFYYNQLKTELAHYNIDIDSLVTHKEFVDSCRIYKFVPLVLNAMYIQMTHLPHGYLNNLEKTNVELYNYICETDRSNFIVDQMQKDEYHREFLFEAVGELIEEFLKDSSESRNKD